MGKIQSLCKDTPIPTLRKKMHSEFIPVKISEQIPCPENIPKHARFQMFGICPVLA